MLKKYSVMVTLLVLGLFFSISYDINAVVENNTMKSAIVLKAGESYKDKLKGYSDVNYYKVELKDSGKFAISFKTDIWENTYSWNNIQLLDENGERYILFSSKPEGGLAKDDIGLKKGTYYIKVTGTVLDEYSIKFQLMPENTYEREFNDTQKAANDINVNKLYSGRVSSSNDIDYYKISIPETKEVEIRFEHEIGELQVFNVWKIEVMDKYGKVYKEFGIGESEGLIKEKVTLKAGVYYIKIQSGTINSPLEYKVGINGDFSRLNFKVDTLTEKVDKNYVWNLKFDKDVDVSTIMEGNIYILDEFGYKVLHNVCVEGKNMYIYSVEEYETGKKYSLNVDKIKFKDKSVLNKQTKTIFYVK